MDKNLRLASLWDEWLASPVKTQSQADYEASGLLLGMRNFTTNRLTAARRLTGPGRVRLWSLTSYAKTFPLQLSMTTGRNRKPSVRFSCPPKILKLPKTLRASWSWLKGLWGSTGGLYFPKSGYYLTLIVSEPLTAEITRSVLTLTGLAWNEHRTEFTLRNYDDVMTFLCNTGMPSGALDFDETALIRAVRSRANRESNYDSANIARAMRTAHEQRKLAEEIIGGDLVKYFTITQQKLITLRLEYPDATLEELGRKLTPQIHKSAVKYHWDKIRASLAQITAN